MTFPFSAVVGQPDAQLALILGTVDPGIGGVLLRGDKGSAKSTLARGLAGLIAGAPFVELPIGATEDRLAGGLDVDRALSGHGATLRPGLLAAAHGGVLYVDEVNLLADHLVDILLDAAASGVHRVERDGISVSHPARFVLVGSMNPEEGELRPQLLDRFGLAVEVRSSPDARVRATAVRNRLAFEQGTLDDQDQDRVLADRLASTRPAALPSETISFASRLAVAAGAESLRADLVLCRAAAALAGWEGRSTTSPGDVERVAGLVLAHRHRRRPFDPPTIAPEDLARALEEATAPPGSAGEWGGSAPGSGAESGGSAPGSGAESGGSGSGGGWGGSGSGGESGGSGSGGGWGRSGSEDESGKWSELAGRSIDRDPPSTSAGSPPRSRLAPVVGPGARGPVVGSRSPGPDGFVSVAVAATVRAGAIRLASGISSEGPGSGDGLSLKRSDVREPLRRERKRRCIILVVDTSGSMGTQSRIQAATGAVLHLLADAYRYRQRVALVAFRGSSADVALQPTASVEVARARLGDLATGGATPLAEGLAAGLEIARRAAQAGDEPLLVLLSDGRATAGDHPLERAMGVAGEIAGQGIESVVLDAEDNRVPLGLARRLAEAMHAPTVNLHDVSAEHIARSINERLNS